MADPLERLLNLLADQPRHDPHDARVRLAARLRARDACEYCLLPTLGAFHLDHIIPPSRWQADHAGRLPERRGPDHLDNLAWACPFCNERKGKRTMGRLGRRTVRLFDPRHDTWAQHFALAHRELFIIGQTDIGWATIATLHLNDGRLGGPLAVRHSLIVTGAYPPAWARAWGISLD